MDAESARARGREAYARRRWTASHEALSRADRAAGLEAGDRRIGDEWDLFAGYNVELASRPSAKTAGKLMRMVAYPGYRRTTWRGSPSPPA